MFENKTIQIKDTEKENLEEVQSPNTDSSVSKDEILCSGILYTIIFFFIIAFALCLVGASVCFIVFGVIFLVEDYKVADKCSGSDLWEYVLVTLILTTSSKSYLYSENLGPINFICIGFIDLGLAIWGGIEICENTCDELEKTNLWKFSISSFVLQLFLSTLLLVVCPLLIIIDNYFRYKKFNSENNVNKNSNTDSTNKNFTNI